MYRSKPAGRFNRSETKQINFKTNRKYDTQMALADHKAFNIVQ